VVMPADWSKRGRGRAAASFKGDASIPGAWARGQERARTPSSAGGSDPGAA
jgi:hypothetical protein